VGAVCFTSELCELYRVAGANAMILSLKTKGTTPKEVTGKYVVVWEKVGKNWKLAADIWNDGM